MTVVENIRQPAASEALAAAPHDAVTGSTLEFYRRASALRHELKLGRGELRRRSVSASVFDVEICTGEKSADERKPVVMA